MKTVAVFAGDHRQFFHFLEENILPSSVERRFFPSRSEAIIDGVRYIYIGRVYDIRGISDIEIVYYGTWCKRAMRDIDELEEFRKSRETRSKK